MNAKRGNLLMFACGSFMIGSLVHSADHLRRGWALPLLGLTPEVFWAGAVITVAVAVTLGLAISGNHWAPRVAAAAGLSVAVAVSAAHFAPPWGDFSNSYLALNVDPLAWAAALAEVAGALFAGFVGLATIRRQRLNLAL